MNTQPLGSDRFRTLIDTLTRGIMVRNEHGVVLYVNPAASEILGYAAEELIGTSPDDPRWQFVDEDGSRLPPGRLPGQIALQSGDVIRARKIGVLNPLIGRHVWLQIDAIPQYGPESVSPDLVCVLLEEVAVETSGMKALHASKVHLERAQRMSSVGSAEIDLKSGAWRWSEESFRIFGRDKKNFAVSTETILPLIVETDRGSFLASLDSAGRGIAPTPAEFSIVRRDGAKRTITSQSELVKDELGCIRSLLMLFRDVTEHRLAEQQEQETQKRLEHGQRMQALGVLAGGIAHDLNNTLVPVLGLSDLAVKNLPANSEVRTTLEIVRDAGLRARELVRQVLTFARGDEGDPRPLDLGKYFNGAMRLLRASVPSTIKLQSHIDDHVPTVRADSAQLHQVIMNLVANASQAIGTDYGTITIEVSNAPDIRLRPTDTTTVKCARISVSDTGSGMDTETKARAFEPFFTTRPLGQGTGLGLSVVHGIIERHNGRIEITSALGEGTRFDIYLPALTADER